MLDTRPESSLAAIATIATVISLMGNVVTGQWHDAALDAIGLCTFGIGRAVGAAARAAKGPALQAVLKASRSTVGSTLNVPQRLRGLSPGAVSSSMREAREIIEVVEAPFRAVGRSFDPGAHGWARHAYHGAGSDLVASLKAPFKAENWAVTGNPKQWFGLTDMGAATSDLAGNAAAAARRAAAVEAAGIGGGTASGLATHDEEAGFQPNAPIGFNGEGFPVHFENPFSEVPALYSELPGISDSHESPWPEEAAEGASSPTGRARRAPGDQVGFQVRLSQGRGVDGTGDV